LKYNAIRGWTSTAGIVQSLEFGVRSYSRGAQRVRYW